MKKKTGWKPLPFSLKVIFVVYILGVISSIFMSFTIVNKGYPLLGFLITGIAALIPYILVNVIGGAVLLIGFWERYRWAWGYSIGLHIYFILNGLLGLITLEERMKLISTNVQVTMSNFSVMYTTTIIFTILFGIIPLIIITYFIYKNKPYFYS